jgi:hypothetical protein
MACTFIVAAAVVGDKLQVIYVETLSTAVIKEAKIAMMTWIWEPSRPVR